MTTPVDLDQLEQQLITTKPPPVTLAAQEAAPDLGKLSADAVLEQYNMAAKSVEDMGEDIKQCVLSVASMMEQCTADLKLIKDAADTIRQRGKNAHAEVERTSGVLKDIREIVSTIKSKLG